MALYCYNDIKEKQWPLPFFGLSWGVSRIRDRVQPNDKLLQRKSHMLNFTVCNPAVSLEWQFWTDAGGTHIETIGRSGYNICWTQCHWSKSANTDSFPMRNRDVVSIKSADNLTQPLNEYNLVVHATQCAYNSRYFLLSRGMCLKNAFLPRYFFHRQNCVTFIYFKVAA